VRSSSYREKKHIQWFTFLPGSFIKDKKGTLTMKRLMRKCIENLTPYPPGKPIEELERELGIVGSIKLASNENPLGPSPKAIKAINENLNNIHRYPDGSCYYLRQKLAKKFGLSMDKIIVGNGSNEIIKLVVHVFLSPDEEVILPLPTFLLYEKVIGSFAGKIVTVPLSNFSIDLPGILKTVSSRTKIIFISNPNNPTGKGLKKEDISRFLHALPSDVVVVLDEAYIEFANDPDIASAVELLDSYPLLVVLRTFSKVYGLAGLRIGYGFASEMITDGMNLVRQPFNANYLAQVGASAALDDDEFIEKTLTLTRDGLEFLYSQLDRIGLEYVTTQTNFFLIKTPLGAGETYRRMLGEGVIVRSMESFGLEGYIRISVGLPEENKRFIRTLEKILS
jgi:histidinol-phosphate aminotransferase